MPAQNEVLDRQIVPRLRLSDAAQRKGEFVPLKTHPKSPFTDEMVRDALEDWQNSPGFSTAADLVSVALTLGRDGVAREAAEFVLADANGPETAKRIAEAYLGKQSDEGVPQPTGHDSLHGLIHSLRYRLNDFPRNPLLWSDLAVAYTALGQDEKAKRAINVSLALAPADRFILRTASRIFLHEGDEDRAHGILVQAPQIKTDPWLLSAEIATAQAIEAKSSLIKRGQKLLEASTLAPHHLSELASALATVDAKEKNFKAAKKLVKVSLTDPTENAVAQAAWLSRSIGLIPQLESAPTDSFEAATWLAREREDWPFACQEAKLWQHDQPFSSRPAIFGSYVAASLLHNYALAIDMATEGLVCNANDFTLHNNCAFALAHLGRTEEAVRMFSRISIAKLPLRHQLVANATIGFIFFRIDEPENGRRYYDRALEIGKKDKGLDLASSIARGYYALEERRVGGEAAEILAKQVIAASQKPNADALLKHLANQLKAPQAKAK